MKRSITIGHDGDAAISMDLMTLVDTRLLVQANSGGGKSGTLRLIAERASPFIQTIILDNDGEFATLREKVDMLLIGEGGEVPATVRSAPLLARRLLESQVSAVVDLYEMKLPQRREFVAGFLEALIALPRSLWRPTLVMLDEAHLYAPQSGEEVSTQPVAALLAQGRKRGYCGIIATQRLSKLHKDVAAECNNVLIGRTWLDVDQVRAGDILGMSKADRIGLRDMPPQTFHGFGPAFSVNGVLTMKTDAVQTTMPKAGHRFDVAVPPPSSKMKSLLAAEFANLPQEAEEQARDLTAARREISDLRRQLSAKPSAVPNESDLQHLKAEAKREADKEWKAKFAVMESAALENLGKFRRIKQYVTKLTASVADLAEELSVDMPALPEMPKEAHIVAHPRPAAAIARVPRQVPVRSGDGSDLPRSQQKIIDTLAMLESVGIRQPSRTQLALWCDVSPTSGGYFNNLGALRTAGYIEYPASSSVALTDAGRSQANPVDPPTVEEMQNSLCAKVGASKAAIVRHLIDIYPDPITRDELARKIGVSPTSGGYFNNLGALRTLGVLDYPASGQVVAKPVLFLEAS